MTSLPSHIEDYLQETGFTGTEILILKKLLEGHALTLRELGGKTGKSTGVLDQATKKLLRKHIVIKEVINNVPKYVIPSVDSVLQWMEEDMKGKRAQLEKKHEDFESFISTLKLDNARPDMEHFDGEEGIKRAYKKLLDLGSELLRYTPVTCKEEDDPLRVFRVDYFRKRRGRKIFERNIVCNNALGQRFQARDAFEYRKTKLISDDNCPFLFEKIIVGNTVAMFDYGAKKACFINFPDFADAERMAFENLWKSDGESNEDPEGDWHKGQASTRTLVVSACREFLLSRKSLAAFVLCGVLAAGITWGLYSNNVRLNTERIREKVLAIATTGAPLFSASDINVLRSENDMHRSEYVHVVQQLDMLRSENEGVEYAYIVRPTDIENMFEFVADSYGLDIGKGIDFNDDGILGPEDEIPIPGMEYDVSEIPGAVAGLKQPTAMHEPFSDQWGTFLSGFAPIKDINGNTIAVLGIDKLADDVHEITLQSFKPIYWFLSLFIFFAFVRLAAFNRSLFQDLLKLLKQKSVLVSLASISLVALGITYGMYVYTLNLMKDEIGQRLMSIAATAAPEIDARDLEKIHWARDMRTPEYQRVYEKLNEIRDQNEDILYVYIMRPTSNPEMYEFVVDADSNYFLPRSDDPDPIEVVPPGTRYDVNQFAHSYNIDLFLIEPLAERELTIDKWGVYVTASAPIKNEQGTGVAIIGLDMDVSDVYRLTRTKFTPFLWFFGFFVFIIVMKIMIDLFRKIP